MQCCVEVNCSFQDKSLFPITIFAGDLAEARLKEIGPRDRTLANGLESSLQHRPIARLA